MCSPEQQGNLVALVGELASARICGRYADVVGDMGESAAILRDMSDREDATAAGLNVAFVLFSAYLIFAMQAGYAMISAGFVRSRSSMSVLMMNITDAAAGAIAYYLFGYGFSFGIDPVRGANPFIGSYDFALSATTTISADSGSTWQNFLFQWAFSTIAATIISGAVAERCQMGAYLGSSIWLSAFVYPVVCHWLWDTNGWLSAFNPNPMIGVGAVDFAGSAVVHMMGGFAALAACTIIGPRTGRFEKCGRPNELTGHSVTLVVLGTFLVWFGWYGFGPGSTLAVDGRLTAAIAARTAVVITLAAASGGLSMLAIVRLRHKRWCLQTVCKGVIAGLVAISAGCSVLQPWAALITGLLAGFTAYTFHHLLLKLRIDDVVDAFPVHGACGALGMLITGFLADPYYMNVVYRADPSVRNYGAFYGGNGKLLAAQIIAIIVVALWSLIFMGGFFFILHKLGRARVCADTEQRGYDRCAFTATTAYEPHEDPVADAKDLDAPGINGATKV